MARSALAFYIQYLGGTSASGFKAYFSCNLILEMAGKQMIIATREVNMTFLSILWLDMISYKGRDYILLSVRVEAVLMKQLFRLSAS